MTSSSTTATYSSEVADPDKHTITVDEYDNIDVELFPRLMKNEVFHLTADYIPKILVGKGSYGMVVSAIDINTQMQVAIKKCCKVFPIGIAEQMMEQQKNQITNQNTIARQTLIPKRILRELKILAHLNHPNIINLKSIIPPSSYKTFKDVYMVTDLMEADLRDFLVTDQQLSDRHIQYLMFQILSAISYVHRADILHRDLKPENILVNTSCEVKICDFGLARGMNFDQDATMSTNYVQTRWYRAPELLLNNHTVSKAIDIWSIGCVMAELMGSGILFKGSSPINQLEQILRVLGTQEIENVKGSPQGLEFLRRMPTFTGRPLESLFPKIQNPDAIDLLKKMLQFNPDKRISADEALRHPYLCNFFKPDAVLPHVEKFDFSFETDCKDLISIKREAFNTILKFNCISRKSECKPVLCTKVDRDVERKKIAEGLTSPSSEEVQRELIYQLQKEMEQDLIREASESSEEKPKKKGMFYRMRRLLRKTKCLKS
ncbi:mitogen-activated protein kinase [Acrasis kona]|uniref:Mitogen-activated protein kinase n=1 Tax=Acrasis kona TaxID=1008807 RepID=A0AAW2Z3G1_9EUKA